MDFVDDVDAIRSIKRSKFDVFSDFPDIVHTGVRCAVDFDHIDGMTLGDLRAIDTRPARHAGRTPLAVEGLREDAGHRRFSDAPRSGKQISLGYALGCDRVDQRLYD